ncbi:MAG: hypothetical protein U0R50_15400 [Gaiellales bacterium]
MLSLLIFLGALVAIAAVAIIVNRVKGVRAQYLEAWSPAPGERRVFDDPTADFYVIPSMGQAKVMSFARRRRTHAVLTDARLLIGTKPLMSRRHMITHVVQLADNDEAQDELDRLTGGQFTKGFVTYAARAERMTVETDGRKTYVRIVPEPTASAFNVEHCRLYTDMADELTEHAGAGRRPSKSSP